MLASRKPVAPCNDDLNWGRSTPIHLNVNVGRRVKQGRVIQCTARPMPAGSACFKDSIDTTMPPVSGMRFLTRSMRNRHKTSLKAVLFGFSAGSNTRSILPRPWR